MEMLQDVDLQPYNSFSVPARAAHFVAVNHAEDLPAVFRHAAKANLRVLVLGGGSNVLFVNDYPGLVLHMSNQGMEFNEATGHVRVAAGENWHQFVTACLKNGFHGLENLALIPG